MQALFLIFLMPMNQGLTMKYLRALNNKEYDLNIEKSHPRTLKWHTIQGTTSLETETLFIQ